ncbi:MAG: GTPase HflX [Halovenus sp.]
MLQTAIIAKRVTDGDPATEEIRQLTEAAGARVVGEVTQSRARDPGTELGAGKVARLADMVAETGADTVVVDGDLTPGQTVTLEDETGTRVVDRHRVVLEIFARQARTRRAQLQVELARLQYRLPRVRERADEGALNRRTEKGTRYYDLRDRIDELERKLDDLPAADEQFRERRRQQGFDLVAIAGYTNAGKSTLLRRLADEMDLEQDEHEDIEATAAAEDRLFKTLETTTRRATLAGRPVLLTDTVGFLDDLPHWLVESFRGTLTEVETADAVLLVADIAQPTDQLRRKLEVVHGTLGADAPPVVTVFNKADLVPAETRNRRCEAVADLAPDPVVVSAREGPLAGLEDRVIDALPSLERTELTLPLTDGAMSLVSRIHEESTGVEVTYGSDRVVVAFAAKPATADRLCARAETLATPD